MGASPLCRNADCRNADCRAAAPQVLYHGPREGVEPFFRTALSFHCPPRKGVADFLQEVALPSDQQKYWGDNTRPYAYVTAQTIRTAFWSSSAA